MATKGPQAEPLKFWRFHSLESRPGVAHFISTRAGGVSPPPFDALNLDFRVPDEPQNVLRHRVLLSQRVGQPIESFVTCKQPHAGAVSVVTSGMRGYGAKDFESAISPTDAMVTNVKGIVLMVLLADCVPVLLYDPAAHVVGVAHAGWRGTLEGVTANTIGVMKDSFRCSPFDVVTGIGPSIGPCCYEVGPEVIEKVKAVSADPDAVLRPSREGRAYFDLWHAAELQLLQAGIPQSNIEVAGVCTKCNSELFFSERAQKPTGRFGAGISLT